MRGSSRFPFQSSRWSRPRVTDRRITWFELTPQGAAALKAKPAAAVARSRTRALLAGLSGCEREGFIKCANAFADALSSALATDTKSTSGQPTDRTSAWSPPRTGALEGFPGGWLLFVPTGFFESLRESSRQIIRLDFAVEGGALNVQDGGGLALVPIGVRQRPLDVPLLHLVQRQRLVGVRQRRHRRPRCLQ